MKAGSSSSSSSAYEDIPSLAWNRGGRRMIRDCAGLDSSDEDAELVSAGPGEGGSGSGWSGVVIGSEESLRLCVSPGLMLPLLLPPRFRAAKTEPALESGLREACGLGVALSGVSGLLPSLRGSGESFLIDSEDGGLGRPAAEPARWSPSPECAPSGAGVGDGADEPLAAAAALRNWARTCEVCRSVRKATCWRRKSTVT